MIDNEIREKRKDGYIFFKTKFNILKEQDISVNTALRNLFIMPQNTNLCVFLKDKLLPGKTIKSYLSFSNFIYKKIQ